MDYIVKTDIKDISVAPKAHISNNPWGGSAPESYGQMILTEKSLKVKLVVKEQNPRCMISEFNGNVFQDSCVEFFISPNGTVSYFNMEFNSNGVMLLGFKAPDLRRIRMECENYRELFNIKPFLGEDFWSVEFDIPKDFILKYFPNATFGENSSMKCNFYKCGDCTNSPHYAAWNSVEWETPNFHLPQFFGNVIFE